jgi:hypothetical protein
VDDVTAVSRELFRSLHVRGHAHSTV